MVVAWNWDLAVNQEVDACRVVCEAFDYLFHVQPQRTFSVILHSM